MNFVSLCLMSSSSVCDQLALTLLHFLWQGVVVAILFKAILSRLGSCSPLVRHHVHLTGMALLVACPILTFMGSQSGLRPRAESTVSTPSVHSPNEEIPFNKTEFERPIGIETEHIGAASVTAIAFSDRSISTESETWSPTTATSLHVISQYCVLVYSLGVIVMFLRLGRASWSCRSLRRSSEPISDGVLMQAVREYAVKLKLRSLPTIAVGTRVAVPTVVGLLYPWILIPAPMISSLNDEQIRAIVLHELVHLARRDIWVNLFQRVCEAILFFHPAVWYFSRGITRERENCCDDRVVSLGYSRIQYADVLLSVAEKLHLLSRSDRRSGITLAVDGGSKSSLHLRITRILSQTPPKPIPREAWLVAAFTMLALVTAGIALSTTSQTLSAISTNSAAEIASFTLEDSTQPAMPRESTPNETSGGESVAEGDKTGVLKTRVIGLDGEPIKKYNVLYWRDATAAPEVSDWRDRQTGKVWHQIAGYSTGGTDEKDQLEFGNYLVTVRGDHHNSGPFGRSQPIALSAEHPVSEVDIRLQAGNKIRLRLVDVDNREKLFNANAVLESLETDAPPHLRIQPIEANGVFEFQHLLPGTYSLTASRFATKADMKSYQLQDGPKVIEIADGVEQELEIALKGVPLTEEEKSRYWPWLVHGRVTDANGSPLAGIDIHASAGWGSLFSSVIATTDSDGHYSGRFGQSGMRSIDSDDTLNLVSGQVGVWKDGFAETNLNRQGGKFAAFRMPRDDEKTFDDFTQDAVYIKGISREVNFVLVPAASLTVQVLDTEGNPITNRSVTVDGHQLPPASSVIAQGKTNENGIVEFPSIPPKYEWWLNVRFENRTSADSSPFRLEPGKFSLTVQDSIEELTGIHRLKVLRATNEAGAEVYDSIQSNDPATHAPLPAEKQVELRELLRKVKQANAIWLDGPSKQLKSYRYTFHLQGQPDKNLMIDNKNPVGLFQRRGISMQSAVDYLTANPDQVIFRAVERTDSLTTLYYSLDRNVRISYGNGIDGAWRGFVSHSLRDGKLVLNNDTMTPDSHSAGESLEEYLEYQEVAPGQFAPSRIRMDHGKFDWAFQVHEKQLWLFDHTLTPKSEDQHPIAQVTNVELQAN